MASLNNYNYPHFSPPPSPAQPITPPPPPPAHPVSPPPPPAHPIRPPPPNPHPITPPPPHVLPPPPPPSPPDHHSTIIIIVVSFGGLLFLALAMVALCCFLKKRKKKEEKKSVEETKIIDIDEHLKVKEAIVQGPHGPKTVVLSVEDDVHINEVDTKKIKSATTSLSGEQKMHAIPNAKNEEIMITPKALEEGTSSSLSTPIHHQNSKQIPN